VSTYSILSATYLGNPANSMCLVGVYGQVDAIYVFFIVFKDALDVASASGQSGVEALLTPLMLSVSTAYFSCAGALNPTVNSLTPIPFSTTATQYPGLPSTWTA
jgi:hypothetical protein